MNKLLLASLVASTAIVSPAQAQDNDAAALRAQIAAMQAQIDAMAARLDRMETVATPAPAPAASGDSAEIGFNGAPEIEASGGWSFKPFGRLNMDAGTVSFPAGIASTDGFGSAFRRARLGMEGDIPGGFGYKVEVDFAGNSAVLTDAILSYEHGGLTLTAGQQNNFQSMEELTSSRWSTFIERAAFTDAFGFERRLGLGAQYRSGDVIVQGGVFSDNSEDLPGKNWSIDGRVVFAPKVGDTQLHFGGSLHLAQLETGGTVRYRQRPLVNFTPHRPLATPNMAADSEFGVGLESAMVSGRFHAAGEAFWQTVDIPAFTGDPTFFGGFVEVGYYLTSGDRRGYRGGRWDRTRPAKPIDEGGPGAWQVNLRYDHLDLSDGPITGGTQDGYFASVVWVPTDYTRLTLNYGHLEYADAALPLPSGSRSWSADVLALRGQIDF
ncbi:OprO/OprP family phosphate-selective porin [Altererythrobacter sp. KTW20L]|uniref:OprO/OprP family phosphate-selective porin n=1 Tax=Altererythrobacter sp. KTW20L TaxID=2942210 RepID=UPI0020C11529|nr:porin [Altererythrobacter sp. KTW20L]MCL6251177.1 OprO/OprP family phosphate-selective porin [Altererythrobacter sp. KTW20L]